MSNEVEREAFAKWATRENKYHTSGYNPCSDVELAFQAGAEWQRTQAQPADALVEGLETIALESTDEQARCCAHHYLATYRAAQEKPHD